jgi:hypothetical protein
MARPTTPTPKLARPPTTRWTSFVADPPGDRLVRSLHEQANPEHRLRVEHNRHTLLIHLSDEEGGGWTTFAVDRPTRQWAVAHAPRQTDAAGHAYDGLYS